MCDLPRGIPRVPLYVPRVWKHITDRACLRSEAISRGPQREGEILSVRILFCCVGLAQEDVSPCHRAIAGKHFQNGSTKPLIYDVSFSALVGRRMLGNSIDKSGHSVDHAIGRRFVSRP